MARRDPQPRMIGISMDPLDRPAVGFCCGRERLRSSLRFDTGASPISEEIDVLGVAMDDVVDQGGQPATDAVAGGLG